jgi:hypothetical protein
MYLIKNNTLEKEVLIMKKIKLLFVIGISAFIAACTYPTTITKTIAETTHADGRKTVTVTKSISQSPQTGITKSTQAVVDEFNK